MNVSTWKRSSNQSSICTPKLNPHADLLLDILFRQLALLFHLQEQVEECESVPMRHGPSLGDHLLSTLVDHALGEGVWDVEGPRVLPPITEEPEEQSIPHRRVLLPSL